MSDYKTVMLLLPRLSATELTQIAQYVKVLSANATPEANEDEALVLRCLCNTLSAMGAEFAQPAVLAKMTAMRAMRRKVPALMEYLQHAGMTSKSTQWALLSEGFGLLYKHLNMGSACDASMMMRNIHLLPAVINEAYPGYAKSGLMKKVVT